MFYANCFVTLSTFEPKTSLELSVLYSILIYIDGLIQRFCSFFWNFLFFCVKFNGQKAVLRLAVLVYNNLLSSTAAFPLLCCRRRQATSGQTKKRRGSVPRRFHLCNQLCFCLVCLFLCLFIEQNAMILTCAGLLIRAFVAKSVHDGSPLKNYKIISVGRCDSTACIAGSLSLIWL